MMISSKAGTVRFAALAVSIAVSAMQLAFAQTFPSKPVRVIVAFAPGGGTDAIARTIAPTLSERWGQPVIVDNRPGGGTIIATEITSKATPDGHTFLIVDPSFAINPGLHKKLPYDPHRDFEPVTLIAKFPLLLVVHPAVPAKSVAELIALARAKPGSLTFASAGTGSGTHIAAEIFKSMSGIDIVHIPYKGGGPAVIDLIAGRVSMFFSGVAVLPHARSGKLRTLAVGDAKRSRFVPDVPTVAESGLPGFEVFSWQGIFAPAGVSKSIVAKIQTDLSTTVNLPNISSHLANIGVEPVGISPQDFGAYVRSQIQTYAKVIRAANIRLE